MTEEATDSLDRLLSEVAQGSQSSFAELYDAIAPPVFGLAACMAGSSSLAEPMTRDTFLQVWQRAGGFDPARESARAWILGIAHAQFTRAAEDNRGAHVTASGALCPWCIASSLPSSEREVLTLAVYGRLHPSEIAARTRESPATVNARMQTGLTRLRAGILQTAPSPEGELPSPREI